MTFKEDYTLELEQLEKNIEAGLAVSETLSSEGWQKYIKPVLERLHKKTCSIEGISTLKELQAKQALNRFLVDFQAVLDGFINEANVSSQLMADKRNSPVSDDE